MAKNKKQKSSKAVAFIILLIILALAWAGSYWLKHHKWPWDDIKNAIEKNKDGQQKEEIINKEKEEKIEKSEEEIKSELFRQGTMNDLADKIGNLSPVKPSLGGKWFITRFWFADDRNVYVEYEAVDFLPAAEEDGHDLRRILINISGQEEKPEYNVEGYFEPGENDWVLKIGKDTMIGKRLSLYEYNEGKEEWVRKN